MSDTPTRDASCEARLPDHLDGRLRDFYALDAAAGVVGAQDVRNVATAHHDELSGLELLPSDEFSDDDGYTDATADDMRDRAYERIHEYPLGVTSYKTFRVELSTGGPADWLEVVCSGNTPHYEPAGEGEHYAVERIVYHFSDWFDHAEDELTGEELRAAEAFVSQVVPELVD